MSIKNTIEIILSATDRASDAINKSSSQIKNSLENLNQWAFKNEISLQRMHNTGKEALKGIVNSVLELTNSAGSFKETGDAMDRLTANIGINSKEIMDTLREASRGTIKDYDLMLAANKAMSLGVAKNTDEFTTLMEIARAKSKNMGVSTTQAFSDIVTGLGRGSAQILDNLGIVISASDAYEEYAKSIGKSAKELTDAEKKQVLINKVVQEGKEELEAMGEIEVSAVERKEQLMVAIDNLTGSIGSALLPIVEGLTACLVPIVAKIAEWGETNPTLISTLITLAAGVAGLVTVLGGMGLIIGPVVTSISMLSTGFGMLSGSLMALVKFVPVAISALAPLGASIAAISWPVWVVIGAITALGVAYATNFLGFRDAVNIAREYIKPILEVMGDIIVSLSTNIIDAFKGLIDFFVNIFTGQWKEAFASLVNIGKIQLNMVIDVFKILGVDIPGIIRELQVTLSSLWRSMFNGLKDIANDAISWITNKISAIADKIARARNAVSSAYNSISTAVSNVVGSRASGGTVIAGQLYRVNELGTEYFRPSVNGTISRSNASSPNIQLTFGDVHIQSESDMNLFTQKVQAVMVETYRNLSLGTY